MHKVPKNGRKNEVLTAESIIAIEVNKVYFKISAKITTAIFPQWTGISEGYLIEDDIRGRRFMSASRAETEWGLIRARVFWAQGG